MISEISTHRVVELWWWLHRFTYFIVNFFLKKLILLWGFVRLDFAKDNSWESCSILGLKQTLTDSDRFIQQNEWKRVMTPYSFLFFNMALPCWTVFEGSWSAILFTLVSFPFYIMSLMIVMQTDTGTDLQNVLNCHGVYMMEWRMCLSDVWLQKMVLLLLLLSLLVLSLSALRLAFSKVFSFFLIYNFFHEVTPLCSRQWFVSPTYTHAHLIFCINCFLSCQHCLMHLIFTWSVCCDYCGNLSFLGVFYNLAYYNVTSAFQYIAVSISRPQYDMNKCIIMYVLQ